MINFNGKCFSSFRAAPEELLSCLTSIPIHSHEMVLIKGRINQLEAHYFSIMAALRRFRVEIPMHFTLDFIQEQSHQLNDFNKKNNEIQILSLKFFRMKEPTNKSPVSPICFLMQMGESSIDATNIELTLYKDHYIFANDYSNLFQTNNSLRELGKVFAYENGFGAAFLVNNHKRLVESTHGAVFLINSDGIQTPPLSEGTANTVLRSSFIEFLKKEIKIQEIETKIAIFSIQQAQEVFLISSANGFIHVTEFRKKKFEIEKSISLRKQFFHYLNR
ncbi:MAG: hypothetical protein CMB98_06010 [Flavobacteriaceae bacterium]|nr:hypothetical protein [Flavobacteriaceae bacterium]